MMSSINYSMYMEGSLSEQAVLHCNKELANLPCTEEPDSNDATTVDIQLSVIWDTKTLIAEGDSHNTSIPANGDHNFLCVANYTTRGFGQARMRSEEVWVFVRGIYMHSHAYRCQK